MKALGARFAFYVGFVVGTCTLYVLLRQVRFTRNVGSVEPEAHEKSLLEMIEEENKNWKKERSALFNLNHPHHTVYIKSINRQEMIQTFMTHMWNLKEDNRQNDKTWNVSE